MVVTRWLGAIAVSAIIFTGGFVSGEAWQHNSTVENEVRASLDKYLAARNTFNSEAFMDFFVKSPQLTYVSPNSEYIGWDALRKGIGPVFESHASTAVVSDVRVYAASRNLAIVNLHLKYKTAKGELNPTRSTKIFMRTPEGWKVVAEHSSRVPNFVGTTTVD